MGASQYLRSENLVNTIQGYLTSDVMRGASSLTGESESSTSHAMHSAVPSLLSGLLNFSSSGQGANSLVGMIRDGNYGSLLEQPGSLFAGGSLTSKMMNTGQSLIGKIFGNRASSVTSAIASSSGVKPSSAGTLMSLLAPLTLGVVGKMTGSQGLNASGITNLLRSQRKEITDATPSEVSHILGLGGGPTIAPAASALYEERAVSSPRRWLPWLLAGLVALGLLSYLLSRRQTQRVTPVAATPAVAPTPAAVATPAVAATTPAATGITTLNFETGSTQLTAESARTVNELATTLKADPNAQIQVAGHTDNTGNPQSNQQLSLARANAVKAMLVKDGINANRISATGYGQDRPIADNNSEEGRATNRRTELTVTSR